MLQWGLRITLPPWPEASTLPPLDDEDQFALTVVQDVTSTPITNRAHGYFEMALLTPSHRSFRRTLRILRFLTLHLTLHPLITHDNMILALVGVLEETADEYSFLLAANSLRSLISNGECDRRYLMHILILSNNLQQGRIGTTTATTIQSKLSITLENRCNGAFLFMCPTNVHLHSIYRVVGIAEASRIPCTAPARWCVSNPLIHSSILTVDSTDPFKELKSKIFKLAEKAGGHVGPAAVEALVALKALETLEALPLFPLLAGWDHTKCIHDVRISNVLGYLDNKLPRLDAEVGHDPLPNDPALTNAPETATSESPGLCASFYN